MILLPYYAIRKKRYQMAMISIASIFTYLSLFVIGLKRNPIFTIWFGILPMFITGFALVSEIVYVLKVKSVIYSWYLYF